MLMIKKYTTYIKEWVDYGFEEEPEYDDFITNDEFRQFLIDNNCYDDYIKNYDKSYTVNNIKFSDIIPTNYVSQAFAWSKHPGVRFWVEINKKWLEKIGFIKESLEELDYEEEEDDNGDFITNDEFRQFLIDNDCYDQYIENAKNEKDPSFKNFINKFDEMSPCNYINMAFIWEDTPEGDLYWEDLDIEWSEKNGFYD